LLLLSKLKSITIKTFISTPCTYSLYPSDQC
jgi:hypothetical protein